LPSDARSSLLPAARRFVVLSGVAIVVTAGCAALIGLALGGAAARSAATGLYLVGCFLVVLGVFAGVRGPLRPAGDAEDAEPLGALLGVGIFSKGVRQATVDERDDARATSWLFLAMGIAMVVVGIAIDPRTKLF
jgi:uncharacterized membrane protein